MNRFIGLDLHKKVVEFCILGEDGEVLDTGRFPATRADLEHFARTRLRPSDRLVMEATGNTWPIARLLQPSAAELVVSNPLKTAIIAKANVKTDKVDAAVLAHLLRCNFIPRVWQPDDFTQTLRRLTGRRTARVRDAVRLKNRIHAVLTQNLIPPPPTSTSSRPPAAHGWPTSPTSPSPTASRSTPTSASSTLSMTRPPASTPSSTRSPGTPPTSASS